VTIKELLEIYYSGLSKKEGWESVISDDFKFVGGDMVNPNTTTDKAGYVAVLGRLSRLFTGIRVKKTFIAGDEAFVLANYDWFFPSGKSVNGDVAELWEARDGKLTKLTIFFDTAGFQTLSK